MSKIAHLKVTYPQCEEETSIHVIEDRGCGAKVKTFSLGYHHRHFLINSVDW
jgi:hypothetical protein